jgi:hypothetical protein
MMTKAVILGIANETENGFTFTIMSNPDNRAMELARSFPVKIPRDNKKIESPFRRKNRKITQRWFHSSLNAIRLSSSCME